MPKTGTMLVWCKLRRGTRLVLKASSLSLVDQQMVRKHFQRHVATERLLFGFVDGAHPTVADLAQNAVIAEQLRVLCRQSR